MTIEECESLIQLLKSYDEENINLACLILLSKSYKTNQQLLTAIYRARCIYRKRSMSYWIRYEAPYPERAIYDSDILKCINALRRYKQKLIQYDNN